MEAPRTKRDLENGKTRYELDTAVEAAIYAAFHWPHEEQDEDRTGKGWDVQVVGCGE